VERVRWNWGGGRHIACGINITICGLDLAFCFCNLLAGYIRRDPFVLGAQPLDTSPLSLCQHNEKLLPAKLPRCPICQFEIPAVVLGFELRNSHLLVSHSPA
jgi:hypothetical protein